MVEALRTPDERFDGLPDFPFAPITWSCLCPDPVEIVEVGHFVPEWGETIAKRALVEFNR